MSKFDELFELLLDNSLEKEEVIKLVEKIDVNDLNVQSEYDWTLLEHAIHDYYNYDNNLCEILIQKMNLKGLTLRNHSRYADKANLPNVDELIDKRIEELENEAFIEMKKAVHIYYKYPIETRGFTLVDCTVRNQKEAVEMLTKTFEKINFCYQTPLHIAIKKLDWQSRLLIQVLLKIMSIEDINSSDHENNTVLHLCARKNDIETLHLLLENMINTNMTDTINHINYTKDTALLIALRNNHLKFAETIIPHMSIEGLEVKCYGESTAKNLATDLILLVNNINNLILKRLLKDNA